jgi:hypothetical protein
MSDLIDRRTGVVAAVTTVLGVIFFMALEIGEEPQMSALDVIVELLKVFPVVLMSVGVVLLFRLAARQREEQLTLMRDVEVARLQGQRWRSESRSLLNGLGEAIDAQFSRWNLTEARARGRAAAAQRTRRQADFGGSRNERADHSRAVGLSLFEGGTQRPRRTVSILSRGSARPDRTLSHTQI